MKEKPTVSLQMIVKDEFDAVLNIIQEAYPYFEELNFTVSNHRVAIQLEELMKKYPKVHVVFRRWNGRFDEARNENVEMCHSKYYFWIDCDDMFDFNTIPQILEIAEQGNFDQIMLPYNYAQDGQGNTVALHWRERLLKTGVFYWKGWVHETPITNLPDTPYKAHRVDIPVTHQADDEHTQESLVRNHEILLAATAESDDPRYQLYLGTSFYSLDKFGEAIEILDKFVKVSGNTEDIYRALCCMAECADHMKKPNAAVSYAMQAAAQIPEYPQAYRLMAELEASQGSWHEALEWVKVAEAKPDPEGMGVYDPSAVDDVRLLGSHCEFMLGNYNAALKWLRKVSPKNKSRLSVEEELLSEADAETFITMLPKFRKYFVNEEALYGALIYDLKYDTRLRGLRDIVETPKTWSDKSIVILVGEGYEEWGPHTMDKGMGGSEEAVVYLSRELANMGWEVTVFGAVEAPVYDIITNNTDPVTEKCRVTYLPWREINKKDTFNVFVAWRAPEFTEHIQAKVKVADVHDILNKSSVKDYPDVTYFVKSNFHRNLYPELADHKFRVIGNGIKKEQFNV